MQNLDTIDLLDHAQRGNALATERLLSRYRNRLCQMISIWLDSRLSARLDPADIVQDALLHAAIRLPRYLLDRPMAFYPWLKSLVMRELIRVHRQHLHAQRRSVHREQLLDRHRSTHSMEQLSDSFSDYDLSPSQHAIIQEQRDRVRQVLNLMNDSHREILLMRYAQQMSIRGIAESLAIVEAAAKSRLC